MRVLRDMNEAVLVLDHGGYIVYLNKPASEVLEMDPVDREEKVRFPVDIDQKGSDLSDLGLGDHGVIDIVR